MNKVTLLGRLTRDPELRKTQNDVSNTTFTLAVNRPRVKDKEQETDFINCTCWRGTADTIFKYFNKGNQICVSGQIRTRTYDAQDGTKRYITEVLVDDFDFVDKKETKEEPKEEPKKSDPFKEFADEMELDDDSLPF